MPLLPVLDSSFKAASFSFSDAAYLILFPFETLYKGGRAILTWTLLNPRPDIFIPFYWIGSVTGFFGAYYRGSAWVMVLTAWFTTMNTIALWRLFI